MDNRTGLRIPVSTYRLQFNKDFGFKYAGRIVPYLKRLGISDIYSSPYLKAKKGSLHGYDIVNHDEFNPEIGTEVDYDFLIGQLRSHSMGQILDLVPNHMGIGGENENWMDLLENGPSSRSADFFDIDWQPAKPELQNKILLPILGDQYGAVLESGELTLFFSEGAFFVRYYEHILPVRPLTYHYVLKHRIEEFGAGLDETNPHLVELLSIITALGHLPPYTEKDPDRIEERYREKEVIKKRLMSLYIESPSVKGFIDENLEIINGLKGEPRSFDILDSLLNEQAYRLSFWRVATEEINYRRFFDINDLAGIRVENENVFTQTHRLAFRLIRDGKVTGLRIDHPDGLYDPTSYFKDLQRQCYLSAKTGVIERSAAEVGASGDVSGLESELLEQYDKTLLSDPSYKAFYIICEKILTKGERMPENWPAFSTTGYFFLNSANGLFVKGENSGAFDEIYAKFIREKTDYHELLYEKKKLILHVSLAGELNTLSHYLNRISEKDRHTRDFTLNNLTNALRDVIADFPVYRTYLSKSGISERDRRYIEQAISKARRKNPASNQSVFDFIKNVLLLNYPDYFNEEDRDEWLDFAMRFQQLTGPVMAKGFEDTVFYIYNRLISLNDVGGSPDRFGTPIDAFHGNNLERKKFWPYALITTNTHDSKLGEDVKARINVLSEMPSVWRDCTSRWKRWNKKRKKQVEGRLSPCSNDEYLFYQILIGSWPMGQLADEEYGIYTERVKTHMLKAAREAKVNTSWISIDSAYEDALTDFIESAMKRTPGNRFLNDILDFQKAVSDFGMINSLSAVLLKAASPGVPDFYQGNELWNFTLVDPDNRRPVDYEIRIYMLDELERLQSRTDGVQLAGELIKNRENGMIKLFVTYKALNYRLSNRELFEEGDYIPLEAFGRRANNVCVFARTDSRSRVIVVCPRFVAELADGGGWLPSGEKTWGDSFIAVPFAENGERYLNLFTGEALSVSPVEGAPGLRLSETLKSFPIAMLVMSA